MFSKTCEYAIRACIFIAHNCLQEKRSGLREISEAINSPEAFTAKILQELAKNDIVKSYKGPNGGFCLEPDNLHDINLSQIILAIDGDKIFKACGLGLPECGKENPCPAHWDFVKVREKLQNMLESTKVADLGDSFATGNFSLK